MIEVGKFYRSKFSETLYKCVGRRGGGWEGLVTFSKDYPESVGEQFSMAYDDGWVEVSEDKVDKPLDNHVPGAKADSGKPDPTLILDGMASAILAVAEVATFGAEKYSRDGWKQVPNGFQRYSAAQDRHRLARAMGEERDQESGKLHLAHEAWNALAKLALYLENNDA